MRSSRSRDSSSQNPKPIIVLKLSGSSFLDTVIRDDKTKDPIYILETANDLTSVYRLDHQRDEPVKAAAVQWPLHPVRIKGKTGRSVQFGNGSWRDTEDLLKAGPLGGTAVRKFNIPHYPNSLKWRLIPGNCFCCVTHAVKGPVAVLDAATLSAPPRLKVYHPLIDRDLARSQDNYKGVPTVFLDYLVVTALLLVTDVQEWLDRPREARIPGSSSYTVQRWLALIHSTPAPPEPQHPTVDLSLTVPSTPPHSATIPSPGGYWETRSGVTSLSGSGSGGSYAGDPFTPTTPATPATPATSANSSAFFSRSLEDVPPVPPVPGAGSGSGSAVAASLSSSLSASQPARNAEPGRVRERPKSNPQGTMRHSPHGSMSISHPYPHPQDGAGGDEDESKQSRFGLVNMPGGSIAASSTSAPTSQLPMSASSSSSTSSRPARRQLPVPPGPAPTNSFAQPWLYSSTSSTPSSSTTATPAASPSTGPSTPVSANPNSAAARAARASMRGSLRTTPIPPPPPPPQHSIPLPPKLAQEQERGTVNRPRTAPELDNPTGSRRRHSQSFAAAAGQFGEPSSSPSPVDDGVPSTHPYASTSASAATSSTYSLHGREVGSSYHDHARSPSVAAPDYDAHSFVNKPPPPLPVPPTSSSGAGTRPPARRQLTVVNADLPAQPTADPSTIPGLAPPGLGYAAGACPPPPPSPGDLRLNPRMSYAESVYEMPPPAYDAIDFSVQYVPPVPPIPAHLAVVSAQPLPVHPADALGEGQREV
ncbi:hypothetical protein BD414DRAFT_270047 [Trametes punicea]|nr:hypothetical protein BD414DRAFT_270047 [Trametes punicea]